MNTEEKFENEQFLVITKKLSFLQQLKKMFDGSELVSLNDVLIEEELYLHRLEKLIENKNTKKNISQ